MLDAFFTWVGRHVPRRRGQVAAYRAVKVVIRQGQVYCLYENKRSMTVALELRRREVSLKNKTVYAEVHV